MGTTRGREATFSASFAMKAFAASITSASIAGAPVAIPVRSKCAERLDGGLNVNNEAGLKISDN